MRGETAASSRAPLAEAAVLGTDSIVCEVALHSMMLNGGFFLSGALQPSLDLELFARGGGFLAKTAG
jgi:hypothetical protein